ncbi:MAG: arginine--tRNA ligase, partial [archaeon]|nr:arginine--tRNA ligase [archaeon]
IIGNSIAEISKFQGYKVIKINYLGDWGTQFGKLIVGYKKWGSIDKLKKDSIRHLLSIYVKAGKTKSLDEKARWEFKKLEDGDKENTALWKLFRKLSMNNFEKIYEILNIKFNFIDGESNYNNKMDKIIEELQKKTLLEESNGAQIVNLEKYGLGVCLIKKSDGATLYPTRDITAAIERHKKYKFDKMFYEVGSEQKLHFKQIFKVLELSGYSWAKNLSHIEHGLYLDKDGKKFSTRKGKTIFMSDILEEIEELAEKELKKRYKLSEKELEQRARIIARSAIFYGDLKNHRSNDIVYDIDRFISFEGDTGPYLLYSYARARSILGKAKSSSKRAKVLNVNDSEKQLILKLSQFPDVTAHAFKELSPNLIANYAFQLSQNFNEFYQSSQVIGSDTEQFRLILVDAFSQVLKNALSLLGIDVIEKM